MKLTTLFSLAILALCSSEHAVDYRLLISSPADDIPKDCTASGPFCDTCSSLVGCVEQSPGTWIKVYLANCTLPSFCVNGVCTTDFDPFCWGVADWPFRCQKPGIFPDPFYCDKYDICVNDGTTDLKPYLNQCEDGFRFNLKTDLCDVKLENGQCSENPEDYPVPLCKTAGQTGPLPDKPAMYYLCVEFLYTDGRKVLYPLLDVCPGGEEYVDFKCSVSQTTPTTTVTTTPIPTTSTTTTPTTTTTPYPTTTTTPCPTTTTTPYPTTTTTPYPTTTTTPYPTTTTTPYPTTTTTRFPPFL